MWKMMKQKILQVNEASGIEIVFLQEQQLIINITTAKNKRNKLIKEWFRHGMKRLDELKDVNRKPPVSLILNGKGVLTKKLRLQGEENPVLQVFPQANPAEFYYQVLPAGAYSFVSIARKSLVDETILSVQQAGFNVLDVTLGFSAIEPLLPLMEQDAFSTTSYLLQMNQGNITGFELRSIQDGDLVRQQEYLVSQQYLRPYDLLAFAAATSLLINSSEDAPYISNATLSTHREQFKYRRYFTAAALSLLLLVFLLLLVNFFVYSYYYEQNNRYAVRGHVLNVQGSKQGPGAGINDKELFLQQHKWLRQPCSSFFSDRFAGFLPEGVWLSSLHIYPVNAGTLSGSGMLAFRTDTIQLNGACTDPDRINLLINNIKTMKEVKEVVMKNYSYKKEEDIGAFSLDIITK